MADVIGWVDPDALTDSWVSEVDDDERDSALQAAYRQCLEYRNGRQPAAESMDYAACARAQRMQARALVRATYSGDEGRTGLDGIEIVTFPMDWTVKALLRPRRGVRGPR
jgi:hypothetical protein